MLETHRVVRFEPVKGRLNYGFDAVCTDGKRIPILDQFSCNYLDCKYVQHKPQPSPGLWGSGDMYWQPCNLTKEQEQEWIKEQEQINTPKVDPVQQSIQQLQEQITSIMQILGPVTQYIQQQATQPQQLAQQQGTQSQEQRPQAQYQQPQAQYQQAQYQQQNQGYRPTPKPPQPEMVFQTNNPLPGVLQLQTQR